MIDNYSDDEETDNDDGDEHYYDFPEEYPINTLSIAGLRYYNQMYCKDTIEYVQENIKKATVFKIDHTKFTTISGDGQFYLSKYQLYYDIKQIRELQIYKYNEISNHILLFADNLEYIRFIDTSVITQEFLELLQNHKNVKILELHYSCHKYVSPIVNVFVDHQSLKRMIINTNYHYSFMETTKYIQKVIKISNKSQHIIISYFDFDENLENVIKSPHYNYYSDRIHEIIYYRSLCLLKRCSTKNILLKFLCCHVSMWIVMQVCCLLKN